MSDDLDHLLDRACRGERRALGRLLSIAEGHAGTNGSARANESDAESFERAVRHRRQRRAEVIGVTGAPGAGKSTLTGRMLDTLTRAGDRVAVLAVDPSSPRSGGAILGDRIRMGHGTDDATFIRSVATRGSHGGLASAIPAMIRVLEVAGYETVIIETVGVGQVELDVAALADTTVVVVTPGWGDAIQANKAGILEIADVFAVNKADRPGATDTVRDLEHMLDLAPSAPVPPAPAASSWRPPIVCTVATDGTGIDDLLVAIRRHHGHRAGDDEYDSMRHRRTAAELRSHVDRALERAVRDVLDARPELLDAVDRGELSTAAAARQLLDAVGNQLVEN